MNTPGTHYRCDLHRKYCQIVLQAALTFVDKHVVEPKPTIVFIYCMYSTTPSSFTCITRSTDKPRVEHIGGQRPEKHKERQETISTWTPSTNNHKSLQQNIWTLVRLHIIRFKAYWNGKYGDDGDRKAGSVSDDPNPAAESSLPLQLQTN